MKNLMMMTICLAMVVLVGIGCDSKPTSFNHMEGKWELWREGTISRKKIEIDTSGTSEKRIFILEFKDGIDVRSTRVYEYSKINPPENGRLYCWNGLDNDNTYMWVPSNDIVVDSLAKKKLDPSSILSMKKSSTDIPTPKPPIVIIPTKYEWKSAQSYSPPYHQTVLIRFKDGIVTTAHYTQRKEWKAEVDRKKLSGGIALKDVKEWKFIDLE